ncbi:MAG: GNAT family N-acetyltransferase [Allosphingosinicella sp.]|uniref:GNAT family N-acetyltransferase n=1 Tax=Allosphingosinicella sp. TaxID=2823234 RepID=UPI003958DE68
MLQEQLPKLRDVYIPHADNWVATDGESILGFIGMVENHIGGLFVAPEAHRGGVGRLLPARSGMMKGGQSRCSA